MLTQRHPSGVGYDLSSFRPHLRSRAAECLCILQASGPWGLAAHLGERVEVRTRNTGRASCIWRRERPCLLTVPPGDLAALTHELAHAVLHSDDARAFTTCEAWRALEPIQQREAEVHAFMALWRQHSGSLALAA